MPGRAASKEASYGCRIASGVTILVYAFLALLALDRAGALDAFPAGFSRVSTWIGFGCLTPGMVMIGISRSKPERFTMTPLSLVLAVLALLITLGVPA